MFRILLVLLMLRNARRRVVHFNVTGGPNAAWTGQQIVEAFPWDTAPKFLLRDRDGLLRSYFAYNRGSRTHLGLEKSPPVNFVVWAN